MWKECCSTADVPPPFRRPVVAWSAGLTNLDRCDDADDSWDDGFITRWWTARNECHTYNVTHEHPEYYSEIHSVLFVNEKKKRISQIVDAQASTEHVLISISQSADVEIGWKNRMGEPGRFPGTQTWEGQLDSHFRWTRVRGNRETEKSCWLRCALVWWN